VDIDAAIDHMRSRNEPLYGAWEVCKAAGIDPKRQARLFAHASIISFMEERGMIYTTVLIKSGRKLAAVAAASMFSEDEAKARRAVQAEATRRSTERARESRRHYKSNHSKAPTKARGQETEEVSIPPLDECKRIAAALSRTAKLERVNHAYMKRTGNLPRQDDVANEDRAIMRLILDPVSGSAWHIGNQSLQSIQHEEEQRQAQWHRQKMANITARARQDKVTAEAAYRAGLVARVQLPDPDQLELFAA
jgi:hypothetical protein